MRKARLTLLAIVLLLNLPGSSMPVQTVAAPLTPQADGVYVEDFSTYAYKDYATDTVWDIWAGSLRLARPDAVGQDRPALAADADGNAIVVWQDVRNVNHDIYAERVDAVGNRLWAVDVRVSSDTGTAQRWYPAVGVDGSGNAIVVWNDDRNGNGDIYAQKLDKTCGEKSRGTLTAS